MASKTRISTSCSIPTVLKRCRQPWLGSTCGSFTTSRTKVLTLFRAVFTALPTPSSSGLGSMNRYPSLDFSQNSGKPFDDLPVQHHVPRFVRLDRTSFGRHAEDPMLALAPHARLAPPWPSLRDQTTGDRRLKNWRCRRWGQRWGTSDPPLKETQEVQSVRRGKAGWLGN
jgi:hypothetical protein